MAAIMRAALFSSAVGGLEKNLKYSPDARRPTAPKDGEVLVEILTASVNPIDYKLAEAPLIGSYAISKPASPGKDFCGRVRSSRSSEFQPGQLVYGLVPPTSQFGALAEYAVTSASTIAAVPDGVSPEQAGAAGVCGLTAYQSIVPNLPATQKGLDAPRVFINGGSGGAGTYGIQIAKAVGAYVVTSCSGASAELCRELGADEVIDYKAGDLTHTLQKRGQEFDLVVDNVGTPEDLYRASDKFLKPQGKYIQVGGGMGLSDIMSVGGRMLRPSFLGGGSRKFSFFGLSGNTKDFAALAQLMKEGKVKSLVQKVYSLEEAADAFADLKTGRTKGKIIIKVKDDSGS